jgi:cation transport ATPase
LIRLGDQVRHTVNQNIALGLGFAVILMGLAIAGTLSPLSGALAQNLAAVAVAVNSGRLFGGSAPSGAGKETGATSSPTAAPAR